MCYWYTQILHTGSTVVIVIVFNHLKWTEHIADSTSRQPLWSSGQSSWLHNGDVLCFL
jgi:hypothetical protein